MNGKTMRIAMSLVGLTLAMILGLIVTPTLAVTWGPNASYYNGDKVVSGTGDFYLSGQTYAKSKMTITDSKRDGNTVYGSTKWYFYNGTCDVINHVQQWCSYGTSRTAEKSNTTFTQTLSKTLRAADDRVRGVMQACAQMGFPVPDSCSENAIVTLSY